MTEAEVYILAEQVLDKVIGQITADQWTMKIPEWFQIGRTQDRDTIDLKTIINYHAYDTAWVPDTLTGKTMAEVGSRYDGDLLKDDPIRNYHKFSESAQSAARAADPEATVHLSYGDFPAKVYLTHITSFRTFRAYDIAKLIGADTKLPDTLVQEVWNQTEPVIEDWRKMGVYKEAIEAPEGADQQTKLLCLVGRQP